MGSRKNYKKKSTKAPDPINGFLNVAGAVAMGAYANHKIKKDYKNGCGDESLAAATMVLGSGAFSKGARGAISIGGLMGVNAALRSIEKNNSQNQRYIYPRGSIKSNYLAPEIPIKEFTPLDNSFAWRLNCEDGSEYGIFPEDYETREEYNEALEEAKKLQEEPLYNTDFDSDEDVMLDDEESNDDNELEFDINDIVTVCRVSLLSTGENNYYFTRDDTVNIGDKVIVKGSEQIGIVLTVEKYTCASLPTEKSPLDEIIK